MKPVMLVTLLSAGALWMGSAQAQRWYVAPRVGYGYGGYGGGYGYGYGGYGATTPGSAAGHAMADMVRSQGAYNAMTSAAMVNVEEARSKYIDNQRQWTEVYLMKKRALDAQHAEEKVEARARNARLQEAQANNSSSLPPRLSSSELDPSTGKITWPSALMRDSFAPQRSEIEGLFLSRAHTGTTSELSETIYKKIRSMQDDLRKQIREIVAQEYMDARKFLDRLSLEARFPT
jgi:hypothetical protein